MGRIFQSGERRRHFTKCPMRRAIATGVVSCFLAGAPSAYAADSPLPAPGQWDGKTEKAKLDRPYEDLRQATVPFGLYSYFVHPWRSYMDTWPSTVFPDCLAFVMNVGKRNAEAICKVLSDAGMRHVRYEVGWGNFSWDDKLEGAKRQDTIETLRLFQKYKLRPLILLNSHHAAPCPFKNITVELTATAEQGARSFKVKDAAQIVPYTTGPVNKAEYCAAKPLVTAVDSDGTVHLSGPLSEEMKAGRQSLWVLKYQPVHGVEQKDATPEQNAMWAREAQRTMDGWKTYVEETCALVQEALGTKGQKDAGFDLEVWNEMTFGSNFLNINFYYEKPMKFTKDVSYTVERPLNDAIRPDARTVFKAEGYNAFLAITSTFIDQNQDSYPGVKVDNGFGNQWPWNGPGDAWPGESAMSRHFYLGSWWKISPKRKPEYATINALGVREGVRPEKPKDWYDIVPGTNFIPTMDVGMPEWSYTGFQTESIARDVMPYIRMTGDDPQHGRFSHNGDFRPAEVWQTEFNYGKQGFFERFFAETKAARDDPRASVLDAWLTSKVLLRSYIFQNHKGLKRLYMFAPGDGPYGINMFPAEFFKELKASDGKLTDAALAQVPSGYKGLAWLCRQMEQDAQPLPAPRNLRVDELWEYKPRMQYAGDGTPAHPHQWNREWFAFMPYQVNPSKFVIPYYVATIDVNQIYDETKDPFDLSRYSMPDQDFEVTIGNCAGAGAKVSAYDPLTDTAVPVTVVREKTTANTLTVKLKTVDYPRVLLVEEAKPGPQIIEPKVKADKDGTLTVSWKTNIPVNAARITYGKDWPNRSANEMTVPARKTDFTVQVPTGTKGVLAARIKVAVNGLTCVWPRYDEDTQGQAVVPGSTPADVVAPAAKAANNSQTGSSVPPTPLLPVVGVDLPVKDNNPVRRYTLNLPAGAALTGPYDDREGLITAENDALYLRARYLPGGGKGPEVALPFAAVGDTMEQYRVKVQGITSTVTDYTFLPALHPGLTRPRQRYLLVPLGINKADLLVISIQGTEEAFKAQEKIVDAVMAGILLNTP